MSSLIFTSINAYGDSLEKSIGENSVVLAIELLDKIDRHIYNEIEYFFAYTKDAEIQETIYKSHNEFENITDVQKYISEKDNQWIASDDNITIFIQDLLNNKLSEKLSETIEFFEEKDNQPKYGEIFVTNKYGVVVGLTSRTSDYYQADEEWWQKAKNDSLYVSEIEFDESSNVTSIDICVKIHNELNEFIGVIKIGLIVDDIKLIMDGFQQGRLNEEYESMGLKLFDKSYNLVYAAGPTNDSNYTNNRLIDYLKEDEGAVNGYAKLKGDLSEDTTKLFSHSHSIGYNEFEGLGWVLVMEFDEDEILKPVNDLRNFMIPVFILISISTIIFSFFISQVITKPIIDLDKASHRVIKGDLNTKVKIDSNDEVGNLATTFNKMINNIKEFTEKINKTNDELTQLNQKLEGKVIEINKLLNQKNELINQLGHDLKTPLGPISSLLPVIMEKEENPELKEMLDITVRNAKFMKNLVKKTMSLIELNAPNKKIDFTETNLKKK
jgi:HAMP domain-containing protein